MRYSQSGILKDTRPWGKMFVAGAAAVTLSVAMFASAFAATSVVTSQNMQGWNDLSSNGGEVRYTEGAPAGLGTSSLELRTDNTLPAQAVYSHESDLALSEVEQLSYWTKQVVASNVAGSASMFLSLDLDNDGDWDSTLIHEPYWQNAGSPDPMPVANNVWQPWDVDAGQFWSSRTFTGDHDLNLAAGAGGPPLYTLSALKTGFPEAQVMAYGVNVGTWNPAYIIKVDGISVNGQVSDFESKEACKNNGWKTAMTADDRSFKNQGQCVSYFAANSNASFKKTQ